MEQHDPIPEPLRTFMGNYFNPELFGRYWRETVDSYFGEDPARAALIREQFESAVRTHSITPAEYTDVTGDRTGTQEDLDRWLEVLRQRMFG